MIPQLQSRNLRVACRSVWALAIATVCLAAGIGDQRPLAQSPPDAKLIQLTDPDGVTSLPGWSRAPKDFAPNQIVPNGIYARDARILTIQSKVTDFVPAIEEMLERDGVVDVRFRTQHLVAGPEVERFRDATGMMQSEFRTWIATGHETDRAVKIAGFSIVTPVGEDAGVSAEMFVATPDAFERLGGWVVPTVRYFGLSLNSPDAEMMQYGSDADQSAVEHMGYFFQEWMAYITTGKNMAAIGTLQTLGMQSGTDQAQDSGLQDPVFDVME